MEKFKNKIIHGDCLEIMPTLPDKSVDMILCDLPYGTTACKWDVIIPLEPLWKQYKRIIKDNRAIVLTASQPFTSMLVMSNPKLFKYCWVWDKKQAGNAILAKKQPLKVHEDICVFIKGKTPYNPIMRTGKMRTKMGLKNKLGTFSDVERKKNDQYYPTSILEFSNASMRSKKIHLAQKPVELFEYLIKTYSNPSDIVLDNCIGSGTTAIAALNTGRFFIGIEKDESEVRKARSRIKVI